MTATRPFGPCKALNPCSCCCPGISKYRSVDMTYSFTGAEGTFSGGFTLTSEYIKSLPSTRCVDGTGPDDGDCSPACPPGQHCETYCADPGDFNCCRCDCSFTNADAAGTFTCAPVGPPPAGYSCLYTYSILACQVDALGVPLAGGNCPDDSGGDIGTAGGCGFTAALYIFQPADCAETPPTDGYFTGPLECATAKCKCPNGLYLKFSPIYVTTSPSDPGTLYDADGYILFQSGEPICNEGSGDHPCPCPDRMPCPAPGDVVPCWTGDPATAAHPGHCGQLDEGMGMALKARPDSKMAAKMKASGFIRSSLCPNCGAVMCCGHAGKCPKRRK